MTKHANADDWDDWEDNSGARDAPSATTSYAPAPLLSMDTFGASVASPKLPAEADEDAEEEDQDESTTWTWNLKHMEKDLLHLPPLSSKPHVGSSSSSGSLYPPSPVVADALKDNSGDALFERILAVAEQAARNIHEGGERVVTLEALALITKLHLLSVRKEFNVELQPGDAELEVPMIIERLHKIAGDWGSAEYLSDGIPEFERQKIRELSSLLHHALVSYDGDISSFQRVVEQVFASLPDHTLKISVNWIQNAAARAVTSSPSFDPLLAESAYLQNLQDLCDPSSAPGKAVAVLTEAEVFQDAKDIKRDELVINGEFVPGTVGYNAIVDKLQHQICEVLEAQVGFKQDSGAQSGEEYAETSYKIAKQILNACNRTESGGSSYEILGKFVSNHEVDTILIRPDSAKAAPLEIHLDIGAFLEKSSSSSDNSDEMWAFGVRAVLSAVTWYLLCDADDPTTELYEVKTTYQSRLAFSLGLTPFHPLNSMRKDCGSVEIQFMLPQTPMPPTNFKAATQSVDFQVGEYEEQERRDAADEADLDFDELL